MFRLKESVRRTYSDRSDDNTNNNAYEESKGAIIDTIVTTHKI